jgi:hypothetical protein
MEHKDPRLAVCCSLLEPYCAGTNRKHLNEGDSNPVPFCFFED